MLAVGAAYGASCSGYDEAHGHLVGPIADDVSRRIIVAHPNLPARSIGDGAAYSACFAPHKLRVMAADPRACVAANIVSPRFLGPEIDHLVRRRCPTGYRIDVLAKAVVRLDGLPPVRIRQIGPVLRHLRELIRPDQRRDTHAGADSVVCFQDRLRASTKPTGLVLQARRTTHRWAG